MIMKKSDLKNQMVVRLRDGTMMIVVDDRLIGSETFADLNNYSDDLTFKFKYDIVEVFKSKSQLVLSDILISPYKYLVCIWSRYLEEAKKAEREEAIKKAAEKIQKQKEKAKTSDKKKNNNIELRFTINSDNVNDEIEELYKTIAIFRNLNKK